MSHEVLRVFVRPRKGAPAEERESLDIVAGGEGGVRGDYGLGRKRHVTLVLADDWKQAEAALGHAVDPIARRANVLLSGGGGAGLIGTTLTIGRVVLEVRGEVAPCPTMEEGAVGLMEALRPGCRAGVWAVVASGGAIRPGDIALTR